jgi:hypothetical protein
MITKHLGEICQVSWQDVSHDPTEIYMASSSYQDGALGIWRLADFGYFESFKDIGKFHSDKKTKYFDQEQAQTLTWSHHQVGLLAAAESNQLKIFDFT